MYFTEHKSPRVILKVTVKRNKMYEFKIYRRVMRHGNHEWCKNWRGNWLVVSKLTWGIWRISIWALESSKNFHFNALLLSKVYIVWAKKSTEELSFMTLKRYTKFGEESTCHFKIDLRILINFEPSPQKSQKCSL